MRCIAILCCIISSLVFIPAQAQNVKQALKQTNIHFSDSQIIPSSILQQKGIDNFKLLLDSVHYHHYTYDGNLQLIGVENSLNALVYDYSGTLRHSYFADYPYFYSAKRLSYYEHTGNGIETVVKYKTNDNIGPQGYPSAILINSLLNHIPEKRTDTYTHNTFAKTDSIIEYEFQTVNDSLPLNRTQWKYTAAGKKQRETHCKYGDFGNGSQWYTSEEKLWKFDMQQRDTLYFEYREKNSSDTILLPYCKTHTRFVDSLSLSLRYHSKFDTIDMVFVLGQMDSSFYSNTGTLHTRKTYMLNPQTQLWEYSSTEQYKLVRFGSFDTLMTYRTLGTDTVYGDNYTYLFNVQDQLVSTIGWSEDTDSNCYFKHIEIKYLYTPDGMLEHVLHYSYPQPYVNDLVLDGHYQFFYSIHETNINDPEAQKLDLRIYPNPGDGLVQFANSTELEQLEVYDVQGRLMHCTELGRVDVHTMDLSFLPVGLYFVYARSAQGASTRLKYLKTK